MIYTSYFSKTSKVPNPVSIANSKPKGIQIPRYNALVPDWNTIVKPYKDGKLSQSRYIDLYLDHLNKLNPVEVGEALEGKTLLCWEAPDKFCHRHIAAQWLRTAGFEVEEWTEGTI